MAGRQLTRLALIGTMSDLHLAPVAYDLDRLGTIVAQLAPDLLCAEITRTMWESRQLDATSVEVREALIPVVAATDVVLVPVAPSPESFDDFAPRHGLRAWPARTFDRILRWGQRQANTVEAINGPLFSVFCHSVCGLNEWSWSADQRAAWNEQNEAIVANVIEAIRRDPGRRVLLAVQCQRIHKLLPSLRRYDELLELVPLERL